MNIGMRGKQNRWHYKGLGASRPRFIRKNKNVHPAVLLFSEHTGGVGTAAAKVLQILQEEIGVSQRSRTLRRSSEQTD